MNDTLPNNAQLHTLQFSEQEIKGFIRDFFANYFHDVRAIVTYNLNFIQKNKMVIPDINYFTLKRFVDTAIKSFENYDLQIRSGLLGKIYKDITRLHHYYLEFKQNNQHEKVIYVQKFLPTLSLYKTIEEEVEKIKIVAAAHQRTMNITTHELDQLSEPKTDEEIKAYKSLKAKNTDAIYEYAKTKEKLAILSTKLEALSRILEKNFFAMFVQERDKILESLTLIINVKTYYTDQLLWDTSRKSEKIRTFFDDAQIKGDFNIKTFLTYYMKNINTDKIHDTQWHNYLKECLSMLK
jgi:hypothetical protein